MLRRTLASLMAVIGCVILMAGSAQAQQEYILGADNPGGSYYLYGGGLSNWINQNSKTMRLTSQTTRGSVENDRLLNGGRLAFGLSNAIAVYQQKKGIGQFKDQQSDKLRGVAVLDMSPLHIVTFPTTGIKTLKDLAAKRVSIGAAGSGSANAAGILFKLLNITVQSSNLGFSESASNMRDGNLDAFLAASSLPMPAVVDLSSSRQIVLVPVDADTIAAVHKDNPPYIPTVIPGGTYAGVPQDVPALGLASLLVVRADVPDEAVYELVKQIYTPKALEYMHSVYKAWSPKPGADVFHDIGVELHPGALRFYKEQGLVK